MPLWHDLIQKQDCQPTVLILTTYKIFRVIVKYNLEKKCFLLQTPSVVCLQLPSHLLAATTT